MVGILCPRLCCYQCTLFDIQKQRHMITYIVAYINLKEAAATDRPFIF